MRRTTIINILCLSLLVGLIVGRLGLVMPGIVILVSGGVAILAIIRRGRLSAIVIGLFLLLLGSWRIGGYYAQQAALTSRIGQSVTLTGRVSDDPSYDPRGFMVFRLASLQEGERSLPGEVVVHMYQTNLHRGYTLQVQGTIKPPYYQGPPELSYPKIAIISTHQSDLERLRQRFFTGMKTALPEPIASFGLGLLVGVRALIPKALQDQLALVGLSHLVAVSGYNLTIIVAAAHRLLERFGRGLALVVSFWLIGGFLAVTGASASIVRASLVAGLALLAAYYGRRFNPLVLVLMSAAATAAYQPAYLTDLGWLLSFLAFFGIMIVAPAIHARLGHPKRLIVKLLIESSAAQLMTIPLLLYSFGQLSIVAPLTNLIELPLVPLAMLTSFIAGLAGMIVPAFAGWFSWPAQIILQFMVDLVQWTASWPLAGLTFYISLPAMLMFYMLIILATWGLTRATAHHPVHPVRASTPDLAIVR